MYTCLCYCICIKLMLTEKELHFIQYNMFKILFIVVYMIMIMPAIHLIAVLCYVPWRTIFYIPHFSTAFSAKAWFIFFFTFTVSNNFSYKLINLRNSDGPTNSNIDWHQIAHLVEQLGALVRIHSGLLLFLPSHYICCCANPWNWQVNSC